jgi:hypothetical protein
VLKKTLLFTCLVFSIAATTANAGAITATDSGYWDNTGFSGTASFSQYIAGDWTCNPPYCGTPTDVTTRNFFVFDLANVGTITSATLRISSGSVFLNSTYSLYDVDTLIPDLRATSLDGGLQPGIYDDLGTGDSYGSTGLTAISKDNEYIVEISLTMAALDSINAFNGCDPLLNPDRNPDSFDCYWALGGTYELFGFAFGFSGDGVRELVYTTAPTPTPVPATLALFGLGLAGLGWSRRKKA